MSYYGWMEGRIDKGWVRKDRVKIEIVFKYTYTRSEQVESLIN